MLPTWGGPAQPPTSHRGRRAEKQWAEERWLRKTGQLAVRRGCGGGGWGMPSPQPAESPPGELVVAGVSPQGPQMARVS